MGLVQEKEGLKKSRMGYVKREGMIEKRRMG